MSTIDLFLINKPKFFFETYTTVATITINVFQLSLHLEHQEWNQNLFLMETMQNLMNPFSDNLHIINFSMLPNNRNKNYKYLSENIFRDN